MKTIKISGLTTFLIFVLFSAVANAQTKWKTEKHAPTYFPDKKMGEIRTNLANILEKETAWIFDEKTNKYGFPKDFLILEDRFEFTFKKNQKIIINFSDLCKDTIEISGLFMSDNNGPYYLIRYVLYLGKLTFSYKKDYKSAMQIADDLFFIQKRQQIIQQQLNVKRYDSLINVFKPIAAQYNALKVKPPISEEQRKYIVQANAFNEQKEYEKAIEKYAKAIEFDPTSYPAAYSNLALLSAQIHMFDAAIYYMKKYLMLVPEAEDARRCQDKIYQWEIMIQK